MTSIIIAALAAAVVGLASVAVYLGRGWRNAAARVAVGHTIIDRQQAEIAAANDAVRMAQGRAEASGEALAYTTRRLTVALQQLAEQAPSRDEHGRFTARKAQDAARKLGRAK